MQVKQKLLGYLLVVSKAQRRQVGILLSKIGKPADHPGELMNMGEGREKGSVNKGIAV